MSFDPQRLVLEFHRVFDAARQPLPNASLEKVPDELRDLRLALIEEEFTELKSATADRDLTEIADALADLVYVVYGTAVAYGIDLSPVLEEVHRSNMTKVRRDGTILRRADGKILKPVTFDPPDISRVLGAQTPLDV